SSTSAPPPASGSPRWRPRSAASTRCCKTSSSPPPCATSSTRTPTARPPPGRRAPAPAGPPEAARAILEGVRSVRPALVAVPLLALVVVGAAGCPKHIDPRAVDTGLITVSSKITVRTDKVGDDGKLATFVLVDAENRADRELTVALAGDLVDARGEVVGHL